VTNHLEGQAVVPTAKKLVLLACGQSAGMRLMQDATKEEQQVVDIDKRVRSMLVRQQRSVQTAAAELVSKTHLQHHGRIAGGRNPVDAAQQ
jgi:hypothetical protein